MAVSLRGQDGKRIVIDRYRFFITDTDTDIYTFMYPITDIQNRCLFTVIK